MISEPMYFLVPASGGLCIQPQNNGIYTANVEGKEGQQWSIEKGEGDKIAFRSGNGKQYLRAKSGNNSGQVVLGQRQWWKLEGSKTPGAFWIKNEEFPKAYLCNSYGRITPNNLIYMWAPEPYWTQTMLWYLRDVESWKAHNGSSPELAFSNSATSAGSAEKAKAKEAELETRQRKQNEEEESLERQKREWQEHQDFQVEDLKAKEKALEKREKELSKRTQEVKEFGSKAAAATDEHAGQNARIAELQRQLGEAQAALADSQRKEREGIERERKAAEAHDRPRQDEGLPAAITNSEPHGTRIDDSVVAHRLQPLFERTDGDTSGAMRDPGISAHGLQPLFERTRPKPKIALRNGDISAQRLQPFFERPACGNCRMSHAVGES